MARTTGRLFAKFDLGYLDHPKVAPLLDEHPRAIVLHVRCILYSRAQLTDGIVPMRTAMRLACAEQCDLDALVAAGLVRIIDANRIEVHDYLDHQDSSEEVRSRSDQRKRAAEARWSNASRNASRNASSVQRQRQRQRQEEKDSCASADAERYSDTPAGPTPTSSASRRKTPGHDPMIDLEFARWWDAWPRKKAKGQAARAYRTARRKTDAQTLLAAVEQQTPALMARGAEFCPYPATWLNGERWTDQPDPTSRPHVRVNARQAETDQIFDAAMARAIEHDRTHPR